MWGVVMAILICSSFSHPHHPDNCNGTYFEGGNRGGGGGEGLRRRGMHEDGRGPVARCLRRGKSRRLGYSTNIFQHSVEGLKNHFWVLLPKVS